MKVKAVREPEVVYKRKLDPAATVLKCWSCGSVVYQERGKTRCPNGCEGHQASPSGEPR